MAKSKQFLHTRWAVALLGAVSLGATWLMFIRAVDTGSLQQYGLTIVLFSLSVNRFFRALFPKQQ